MTAFALNLGNFALNINTRRERERERVCTNNMSKDRSGMEKWKIIF